MQKKLTIPIFGPQFKPFSPAIGQTQNLSYGSYQPTSQKTYDHRHSYNPIYDAMIQYFYQMDQQRRIDEEKIEAEKRRQRDKELNEQLRDLRQKAHEIKLKEKRDAELNYLQFQFEMDKEKREFYRELRERKSRFDLAMTKKLNNIINGEMKKRKLLFQQALERQDKITQEKTKDVEEQDSKELEHISESTILQPVTEPSVKDKEYEESDEIQVSDSILLPLFSVSVYILRKFWKFYNTPESKLPKNNPMYGMKISECMRDNNEQ